jgi:hypothetical protein
MNITNTMKNFSKCLGDNLNFTIPSSIVLGISLVSNLFLVIKLIMSQKNTDILEKEIEITNLFPRDRSKSDDLSTKEEM